MMVVDTGGLYREVEKYTRLNAEALAIKRTFPGGLLFVRKSFWLRFYNRDWASVWHRALVLRIFGKCYAVPSIPPTAIAYCCYRPHLVWCFPAVFTLPKCFERGLSMGSVCYVCLCAHIESTVAGHTNVVWHSHIQRWAEGGAVETRPLTLTYANTNRIRYASNDNNNFVHDTGCNVPVWMFCCSKAPRIYSGVVRQNYDDHVVCNVCIQARVGLLVTFTTIHTPYTSAVLYTAARVIVD